jgi:MFS family permease
MTSVLKQRNFALLWIGQVISMIGDWVLIVALPFYIYNITGSTLAAGGMFMAVSVPRLLLGSFAGVFVDRWDRRKTMIAADLSRAVLLLLLFTVRSSEWLWLIYAVAIVESSISQFFIPAKSAIIPNIVGEQNLVAANSLDGLSDAVTRLLGPTLGGVLFGLVGLIGVVTLDSASYLLSALLLLLIAMPKGQVPPERVEASKRVDWLKLWHEWMDGLRLVKNDRLLSTIFTSMGVMMIGEGILQVLVVALVKLVLHGDAEVLGWLLTAQGVGALLGSALLTKVSAVLAPKHLLWSSFVLTGVFLIGIVNIAVLPVDLVLMGLAGVCIVWAIVTAQMLMQKNVADEYRGRVFGSFGTTNALLVLVGMGLASVLGSIFSVSLLLTLAGCLFIVSALLFTRMPDIPIPVQEYAG